MVTGGGGVGETSCMIRILDDKLWSMDVIKLCFDFCPAIDCSTGFLTSKQKSVAFTDHESRHGRTVGVIVDQLVHSTKRV